MNILSASATRAKAEFVYTLIASRASLAIFDFPGVLAIHLKMRVDFWGNHIFVGFFSFFLLVHPCNEVALFLVINL